MRISFLIFIFPFLCGFSFFSPTYMDYARCSAAAKAYGDPERFDRATQKLEFLIKKETQFNGWSPAKTALYIKEKVDDDLFGKSRERKIKIITDWYNAEYCVNIK